METALTAISPRNRSTPLLVKKQPKQRRFGRTIFIFLQEQHGDSANRHQPQEQEHAAVGKEAA